LSFITLAVPVWSQSQSAIQTNATQLKGARVPNPVVHFEIGCTNRANTEKFFGGLFGWNMQPNGPVATNIDTATTRGVQGHITQLDHDPKHFTIFYVEVDDVKAYVDKAVALGGKIVVPPVKTPTFTFAWISDLDGNTIGLLKPA
jgi:uncharacterized protein